MEQQRELDLATVNCRIGSLENRDGFAAQFPNVNCRIGSLESRERYSTFYVVR